MTTATTRKVHTAFQTRLTAGFLALLLLCASLAAAPIAARADYSADDGLLDFAINTMMKYNPIKLANVVAQEYEANGFSAETAKNLGLKYLDNLSVSVDAFGNSLKNTLYTPGSQWAANDREAWAYYQELSQSDPAAFENVMAAYTGGGGSFMGGGAGEAPGQRIDTRVYEKNYYDNSNALTITPGINVILWSDLKLLAEAHINRYDWNSTNVTNGVTQARRYYVFYEVNIGAYSSGIYNWAYQYGVFTFGNPLVNLRKVVRDGYMSYYKFYLGDSATSIRLYCQTYRDSGSGMKAYYQRGSWSDSNWGFSNPSENYFDTYDSFPVLPYKISGYCWDGTGSGTIGSVNILDAYYVIWDGELQTPPAPENITNIVNNYVTNITNNYYPDPPPTPTPPPDGNDNGGNGNNPPPTYPPFEWPEFTWPDFDWPDFPDWSADISSITDLLVAMAYNNYTGFNTLHQDLIAIGTAQGLQAAILERIRQDTAAIRQDVPAALGTINSNVLLTYDRLDGL